MSELKVKEISTTTEDNIKKTRLIISDSEKDTEIILEGNGVLKIAALEV